MKLNVKFFCVLGLAGVLSACGGGGGSVVVSPGNSSGNTSGNSSGLALSGGAVGTLNTSFNAAGPIPGIKTTANAFAAGAATDAHGNVVIVGASNPSTTNAQSQLWRFGSDGHLDLQIILPAVTGSAFGDVAIAVAIDASGKYVILGHADVPNAISTQMVLRRLNTDGSIDTSFNASGITPGELPVAQAITGNSEWAHAVTVDGGGKILVAGESLSDNDTRSALVLRRYNADGSVDTSFNGSGSIYVASAKPYVVKVDGSGRVVVGGESSATPDAPTAMTVWRFNSDGSVDTSFNAAGTSPGVFVSTPALAGYDHSNGYGLTLDGHGNIVAVGSVSFADDPDMLAVWRLSPSGVLDTSFSANGTIPGIALVQYGDGFAVAIDSNGKIVVAGDSTTQMGVFRLNADGNLDTGFNATGAVPGIFVSPFVTANGTLDIGYTLALNGSGGIMVGGWASDDDGAQTAAVWSINP